jgi:hypothetical protein
MGGKADVEGPDGAVSGGVVGAEGAVWYHGEALKATLPLGSRRLQSM